MKITEMDYWGERLELEKIEHARRMELMTWESEQRVRMYGDVLMKTTYPS